jgi:hypothetical protein
VIPAAELQRIQATANSALDLPCVIKRRTRTPDGYGSATDSWAIIATVQAGMSQPTAGQLANYDFMIRDLATWQIKLPYGTDVQIQDHLFIAGHEIVVQVDLTPRSYASVITVLGSEAKVGK